MEWDTAAGDAIYARLAEWFSLAMRNISLWQTGLSQYTIYRMWIDAINHSIIHLLRLQFYASDAVNYCDLDYYDGPSIARTNALLS